MGAHEEEQVSKTERKASAAGVVRLVVVDASYLLTAVAVVVPEELLRVSLADL